MNQIHQQYHPHQNFPPMQNYSEGYPKNDCNQSPHQMLPPYPQNIPPNIYQIHQQYFHINSPQNPFSFPQHPQTQSPISHPQISSPNQQIQNQSNTKFKFPFLIFIFKQIQDHSIKPINQKLPLKLNQNKRDYEGIRDKNLAKIQNALNSPTKWNFEVVDPLSLSKFL